MNGNTWAPCTHYKTAAEKNPEGNIRKKEVTMQAKKIIIRLKTSINLSSQECSPGCRWTSSETNRAGCSSQKHTKQKVLADQHRSI